MPLFKYVGDEGRTYLPPAAAAVCPKPGETHELAADPGDGRWEPVKPVKPAKPEPAAAGETNQE